MTEIKEKLDAARLIGLITGTVFALALTILLLFGYESPFSFYAVPTIMAFIVPLLTGVGIGIRKPLTGGVLLLLLGCIWITSGLLDYKTSHVLFSPVVLPYFLTGFPFLFSRRQAGQKTNHIPPKWLHMAGFLVTGLGALIYLVFEYISYANTLHGILEPLFTTLISSSGLIFLFICAWLSPRWGGITGAGYGIVMTAFWIFSLSAGQEFSLRILPVLIYPAVIIAGSVLVLISIYTKPAPEKAEAPGTPESNSGDIS
jgi:hypothetical protein